MSLNSLKQKFLRIRNEIYYAQLIGAVIKGLSIVSSASIVPFLVKNYGLKGFAHFSLAVATIYIIASIDFGIANVLNSTSRHDKKIVEERLNLTKFVLLSIFLLYLLLVLLVCTLSSKTLIFFKFFNLFWLMLASYLVILNNLGMKFLLMSENVRKFQLVGPFQQISANSFILIASSHFDLQFILIAFFLISNFTGSAIISMALTRKTSKFDWKICRHSIRTHLKSLLSFQYLQLLAIFNSQGLILVVSRFFSLEIVAFYSFVSRLFQSVNQIYVQLIADHWNKISRLFHTTEKARLYLYYRSQLKQSIYFGIIVNGFLLLFGSKLINFFLNTEYNFPLFLGMALYWTCSIVFLPIAYTFNGLMNIQGGLIWQTMYSVVSVAVLFFCGIFSFPLSLGMLTLSLILSFIIIPLSHKKLNSFIKDFPDNVISTP